MNLRNSIWYFPGDPPVFEAVVIVSLLVAVALAILSVVVFVATLPLALRRFRRASLRLTFGMLALAAIPLGFGVVGIIHRNFGEWAELKRLIVRYSELVGQEVQKRGGPEQIPAIAMHLLEPPPTFKFRAFPQPVKLRIMQTTPPYVGVDFGDGANAVFDPQWMVCLYSD